MNQYIELNGYNNFTFLAEGAFGYVYKAFSANGNEVAVKVIQKT